jgi:hypothetical protein
MKLRLIFISLALASTSWSQVGTIFKQFDTPASINDFEDDPAKAAQLRQTWSEDIIESWTDIAIIGNPWQDKYDHQRWAYFNPIGKTIPEGIITVTPLWFAFPHRVEYFAKQAGYNKEQIYHFADYGKLKDGTPLPCIPPDRCSDQPAAPANPDGSCNTKGLAPWNPLGPRGWLDEYCEWSVKRDGDTIVAINFTCENPEYWNTLWSTDPERTREIIEELVNWGKNKNNGRHKEVKLEDLYLRDQENQPIIDPQTERPAYDTLNKWNKGTHTNPDAGGALHLTSPPNSLGAEIYLAAAATILRTSGDKPVPTEKDENPVLASHNLICTSHYGGVHRNSDPHIGGSVNQATRELYKSKMLTLTDPVGLYIHQPDFSRFEMPPSANGVKIEDCWNIVRGHPGKALHVVFQVPEGKNFTVNDIKVNGKNIVYVGQIAETFKIGLTASAWPNTTTWPPKDNWPPSSEYPKTPPPELDYPNTVGPGAINQKKNPKTFAPQASQPILGRNIFLAQTGIRPQLGFATPRFPQGIEVDGYVLPAAGALEGATVTAPDDSGVHIKVCGFFNDEAQGVGVLELIIAIEDNAPPGLVPLTIRNPENTREVTPSQGLLRVVSRK